jgi:predicted alpha/beta superfamily hydrolase
VENRKLFRPDSGKNLLFKKNSQTMKKFFIILFVISSSFVFGQVTFVVDSVPDNTPADAKLFIAGDFNGWQPGDSRFQLTKRDDGSFDIQLAAQNEGTKIQFKFTRGSWETVEKGPSGEEIENRIFTFGNGDTVRVKIYNWADQGSGNPTGSTAAENVHIVDNQFYIPQLKRNRRIWIYLPPGYDTTSVKYPVLYMHDGQNLFDVQTSYAGEWEVDETLNKLASHGVRVPIVVGIDNGGSYRIEELTPWVNPTYGGGKGELYMRFIVETLKPFVDGHYRTLPDREHTAIMGSSLGGLISFYGALKYQDVFSRSGDFSPSFWFSDSLWSFTREQGKQAGIRFYMLAGGDEGSQTVENMNRMKDSLMAVGFGAGEVATKVVPGGQHNEKLWREHFEEAYLWLFQDFINGVKQHKTARTIHVYPNPVGDMLNIESIQGGVDDSLLVSDVAGRQVMLVDHFRGRQLKVCGLAPGIYFLRISTASAVYQTQFVKR